LAERLRLFFHGASEGWRGQTGRVRRRILDRAGKGSDHQVVSNLVAQEQGEYAVLKPFWVLASEQSHRCLPRRKSACLATSDYGAYTTRDRSGRQDGRESGHRSRETVWVGVSL
jgi:hypothetical protein